MMLNRALFFLVSFLILLTACSPGETETPEVSATPTMVPSPTETRLPTNTPTPTNTTTPTLTATPSDAIPGAVGIGDPYFPEMGNGGYDVAHYNLDLTVDVESNHLTGVATIDATTLHALETFNLDFIGFDIHKITVDQTEAVFGRTGRELRIIPEHPIGEGNSFRITITYSGVPGDTGPSTVTNRTTSWIKYDDGIMVAGEPTGSSGWYPVNEHPADKAAYTFTITVPKPYSVAANGQLKDTIDLGDDRTFIWDAPDPMASYLVTVNIAEFDVETKLGPNDMIIRNYFARGVPFSARDNFDRTPEMIEFFNEVFGPYPFDVYGVVVHNQPLGFALETQTLSFFGASFNNEEVISHELAHQWFGDSVGLTKWQDIWLNEGFATYASTLWVEHEAGSGTLDLQITNMYRGMAPGQPVFQVPKNELLAGISAFPLEGENVTSEQVRSALISLFSSELSDEEITEILDPITDDGIPRESILEIIDEIEFSSVTLTNTEVTEFFTAIGLGELTNDPQTFPPPGNPSPSGLFSGSVYQRGALTLHALRLKVGDDIFFDILQTYHERFAGGNASTDDFIFVAEELSEQNLGSFFDGWLYAQNIPDIPEMSLFREDFLP